MTQLTLSNYLLSPTLTILNGLKSLGKAIEQVQVQRGIRIVSEYMMNKKAYRDTYRALSAMSDRELTDIGISRDSIHGIAMEAYYDNQNKR